MSDSLKSANISTKLLKVAERARQEPEGRFHSLAHLIDVETLKAAYNRSRKDAAVDIDGLLALSGRSFIEGLKTDLEDLLNREGLLWGILVDPTSPGGTSIKTSSSTNSYENDFQISKQLIKNLLNQQQAKLKLLP